MTNYIYKTIEATVKNSIDDCIDELGSVDYETCIDHWQQVYIDELEEEFDDVEFDEGCYAYLNATVTIDNNTFELSKIYDELTMY